MEHQVPKEIIEYYKPYENKKSNIRVQNVLSASKFEMDDNYSIIDSIGQGAYGIVVAARDLNCQDEENNLVAIKKIEKAFEHKIFTKRTLRELRLLRLLKHENIIGINTLLLPRSREKFEDIYVVSELMETDLASIIKSEQPLTDEHCQFFLYQILRGLKYIHSAKVVHRDLKPRNLLVNSNCDLKICDFGLARTIIPGLKCRAGMLTDYVATRWYRAPELLLSWRDYDEKVDVWSVGCIFAELLRRKPFLPGIDTRNQIELIFEYLGTPSEQEINNIPREKFRKMVKNMPKRQPKQFEKLFSKASKEAIDLLRKLLTFDFTKRITVDEALSHPYLSELHFPEDEPTCEPVSKLDFEFEEHNLTLQQLKDLIYEEILYYHYPSFKQEYETKKANGQSLISHIINNANRNVPDPHSSDDDQSDDDDEN
ncbi:MAP kinase (macronuclear) [Tetrahymena thermophila SB210]|uniref:Mitogen-activated protein kinase n=1 Tax=Tetrahymena thermophila (strain SB210) TaxID=312017 RepID=I7LZI0_TETTS|nr:MAP kinase [Tetrahymena thermophila SB210]EAR83972.2 MAP kinase [Tetrahymena thermophila SB210]|eukprot:XP_001031635.2 MAP kinase [Tetrahymena thermophila SB210]